MIDERLSYTDLLAARAVSLRVARVHECTFGNVRSE